MFVQNNEVCDVVGTAGVCEFFYNIVSAIYSMGVGEYEPHFLHDGHTIVTRNKSGWYLCKLEKF